MLDVKKIRLALFAVIISVLLFELIITPHGRKISDVKSHPPSSEDLAKSTGSPRSLSYAQLKKEAEAYKLVRDPFNLRNVVVPEELRFSGIVRQEGQILAVINDQIVKPGGKVEGSTVISVGADKVILDDGARRWELLLGQ